MKLKSITSLFCAGTLLFGLTAAPIGQAQAYTVDPEPSGSAEPAMPDVLKNRAPVNHVYDLSLCWEVGVDQIWDGALIMPGDTVEFKLGHRVNEKELFVFGSLNYKDGDLESSTAPYVLDPIYDGLDEFTRTGALEPTEDGFLQWNFEDSTGKDTVIFCVKMINNSNCPLVFKANGGGHGPAKGGYTIYNVTPDVTYYSPYYHIYYNNEDGSGAVSGGDTIDFSSYFWRQGKIENLDFPHYYWLTDKPYSITIPNPTKEGYHFNAWVTSKAYAEYSDINSDDHTTFTVVYDPANSFAFDAGDKGFTSHQNVVLNAVFTEGKTIRFIGRGGTVKGVEEYVAEIPAYDEENNDYGYALEDYAPVKDGDTFLGWCSKKDVYYDSFVTKDDEAVMYEQVLDSYTNAKTLYAKWASETEEDLEKNGWEITDDGTLWLLDNAGANAWKTALNEDRTLAAKVKSIKLGFRDKAVTQLPDGCFYGCVDLTSAEFDDTVTDFGSYVFEGCTSLKTVKFGKNVNVGYGAFKSCTSLETVTFENAPSYVSQAFLYAPLDLLVKIEDGDIEGFNAALSSNASYIYLVGDEVRYPLTVNGELITESNLTVDCGDYGTAAFDPATNTLTLDNAELTRTFVPHSDPSLNGAGIVSMLPELNVVVKGELSAIEIEPINAQGDLNITGEDAELSIESSGSTKSYVIIRSTGKLNINNITATALEAHGDEVYVENCVLDGGLSPEFSSKTNVLVVKNSTVKQYQDDKGTYTPVLYAANVTVENSTLDNVKLYAPNGTAAIKDSTVKLNSYMIGSTDGKLSITNSTVTGTGTVKNGMTDISEENITLTDCEITKGGWKNAGEFEILPSSQVSQDTAYKVSPSIDSWYKVLGGDYSVTINREDGGDIIGDLEKLTIGGVDVDTQYYSVSKEGKYALIIISENFLHTLSEDVRSAEAVFSDGTATFKIAVCSEVDYSPAVLDENWYQSSGKDFTVPIYRDPADGSDFSSLLKEVLVDGNTADADNYSISLNDSASVNVTLKAEYLKTLDDGSHTITALFADGKAESEIVIHKEGTAPDTDTSSDVTSDTQSDTSSDVTSDTQSDTSSDVTSDTKSDTSSDVTSDTKSDTSSDVTSDTKSDTSSDVTSDTQSDTSSDSASDTESDTESDKSSDDDSDTDDSTFDFKKDENTTWTPEQTEGLTLTLENAEESELQSITLNGETVDPSSYTAAKTEGGMTITLSPDFLKTLAGGSYMLGVQLANGSAQTQITVESGDSDAGTYGDLDGDGQITAGDALAVLRASAGMTELSDELTAIADVDGDGSITANDALAVLRSSAGIDDGGNVGKSIAA